MRNKTTEPTLLRLAESAGVQLEFNASYVRELGEGKWARRIYHVSQAVPAIAQKCLIFENKTESEVLK